MVTLTNKTNRQIEIEDKDGVATIINSKQTSGILDESKFTPRTERLIAESKLFKVVIPVENEVVEAVDEAVEATEKSVVMDKPNKKKSTSYKKS